jgi:L,D-peptidoglycan transpeptidase YkuD (ErfK/YbiS/YcfS/YnhG family)
VTRLHQPGLAMLTPGQGGAPHLLRLGGESWRCAIGRGGVSSDKREGDGATPAGRLPLRRVLYRADRVAAPACRVPLAPLAPADGWCDDPGDAAYNRLVTLPHPARHEALWRAEAAYDIVGVLGWNDGTGPDGRAAAIARGRGSAIFLHLARPDFTPTQGCVALLERDLRAALAAGLLAIEVRTAT